MYLKRIFFWEILSAIIVSGVVSAVFIARASSSPKQTYSNMKCSFLLGTEVVRRQNEFTTTDYITLDYSYLDKPLTYWLLICSNGRIRYIQYDIGKGKALSVKVGILSSDQIDRLFKLVEDKNFYKLKSNYDSGDKEMIYEGDIMVVSAFSKGRQHRVFSIEPLAPPDLQIIVDTLQVIPASLQQDSSHTTFVRAEELSKTRAKSLRERGEFEFFTFSERELEELPALKAALESTGFFISVTPKERRRLSSYIKSFPYFFVQTSNREFQLRVFTID